MHPKTLRHFNAASVTLAVLVSLPVLAGETAEFVARQPAALQPYFAQLYQEGDRNAVLNLDRLGVAALQQGHPEIATRSFDQAIARIQAVRTGGSDLDAAKSKFANEASKDFKGEPYEKAMAYYYRGLLYLHDGDFSSAGASFAQVNVEDSVAEDATYQGDFASAKFLNAWALNCTGEKSTSADLYRQATGLKEALGTLHLDQPALFIVETGTGPRKIGTGKYQERLSWSDPGDDASSVSISLPGVAVTDPVRAESLYYQATTRGGRPIEYVLAGKASFKDGAKSAGDVGAAVATAALQVSNVQAQTNNLQGAMNSGYLAVASGLFSMFSRAIESSTTPAADTRGWESLPASIWLASASTASASADRAVIADNTGVHKSPQLTGRHGRCSVSWARLPELPPLAADASEKIDASREAKTRLSQFQTSVPNWFQ